MKYLNKIDSENVCVDCIIADESETLTQEKVNAFISMLGLTGTYIAADRNYIEGSYIPELGRLVFKKPYPSWTLDGNGEWAPPVTHPQTEGVSYAWNESELQWSVVSEVPTP